MRKIFFTFDVEDFTNRLSFVALQTIIELLNKYDFTGLFFITGHVAEELQNYPYIIDMLENHEIGYHSSGHSVHPTIFEFTDIENYREAYEISLRRETSYINPLTGHIEGKGGILGLRKIFPSKRILSYRAPGHCWSPPHTEALRDLGIKFDFSTDLSNEPIQYRGLTFYPCDIIAQWNNGIYTHYLFWLTFARSNYIIIGLHPNLFVTYDGWDSLYHRGNPTQIIPSKPRRVGEIKMLLRSFDLFLKYLKRLERLKFLEVVSQPAMSKKNMDFSIKVVEKSYARSMRWARNVFGYKPKYIKKHFYAFFKNARCNPK